MPSFERPVGTAKTTMHHTPECFNVFHWGINCFVKECRVRQSDQGVSSNFKQLTVVGNKWLRVFFQDIPWNWRHKNTRLTSTQWEIRGWQYPFFSSHTHFLTRGRDQDCRSCPVLSLWRFGSASLGFAGEGSQSRCSGHTVRLQLIPSNNLTPEIFLIFLLLTLLLLKKT